MTTYLVIRSVSDIETFETALYASTDKAKAKEMAAKLNVQEAKFYLAAQEIAKAREACYREYFKSIRDGKGSLEDAEKGNKMFAAVTAAVLEAHGISPACWEDGSYNAEYFVQEVPTL